MRCFRKVLVNQIWSVKFFFFFFGRAENFTLKFDYFHFLNISFVELSCMRVKALIVFHFIPLCIITRIVSSNEKGIIKGVQCKYQQFH